MKVDVYMTAFEKGKVRTVNIPLKDWQEARDQDEKLSLVYHYGQNNIQESDCSSVSVGDIIQLEDDYHMVLPVGFGKVTPYHFLDIIVKLLQNDQPEKIFIDYGYFNFLEMCTL